jgi:RHS repeat-associated protein
MFRDFTHDLENKLTSALPINAGVRTLTYDPLNRLDIYNPGTAKRFIYDGAEVVAELDSSGNIVGRYVRGDGPDEIITGYTSSNPTARGWYHLDERNSVIAITDPNGVVTVVNRYDEYGQPQGGNYGTFQYTGQMWLGEIGVYNYKNRMYWPNERPGGRFMQTDPVGYDAGSNWYVYVGNDPVNLTDPLGLQDCAGQPEVGACAPIDINGGWPSGTPRFGNLPVSVRSFALPSPRTFDLGPQQLLMPSEPTTAELKKIGKCISDELELGVLGLQISKSGAPVPGSKPYVNPGSSRGTSPLSSGLAQRFPQRVENTWFGRLTGVRRIWTPRPGQLFRFTPVVGRAAGRLIPFVGAGLLTYDVVRIAQCVAKD